MCGGTDKGTEERREGREAGRDQESAGGVCTGFWPFQLALYKRQATIEAASCLVAVKEFCSLLLLLHPPTIRATDGGKS